VQVSQNWSVGATFAHSTLFTHRPNYLPLNRSQKTFFTPVSLPLFFSPFHNSLSLATLRGSFKIPPSSSEGLHGPSVCFFVDLYVVFAVGFSFHSMAVIEETILSQGVSQEHLVSFFINHT
jgi:hypothetical protein